MIFVRKKRTHSNVQGTFFTRWKNHADGDGTVPSVIIAVVVVAVVDVVVDVVVDDVVVDVDVVVAAAIFTLVCKQRQQMRCTL